MEKKKSKIKLKKDMTFADALKYHPEVAEELMNLGMHCIGCPMAMMETIEQGAMAHGLNPDEIIKKLNEKIENE